MTTTSIVRLARCTWHYDPRVYPLLAGWRCLHTSLPGTERCFRHPEEDD